MVHLLVVINMETVIIPKDLATKISEYLEVYQMILEAERHRMSTYSSFTRADNDRWNVLLTELERLPKHREEFSNPLVSNINKEKVIKLMCSSWDKSLQVNRDLPNHRNFMPKEWMNEEYNRTLRE